MDKQTARRAPLIIRVPAPKSGNRQKRMFWLLLAVAVGMAVLILIVVAVLARGWSGLLIASLSVFAALGIILFVYQAERQRRATAGGRSVAEQFPDWADDPVAADLAHQWKRLRHPLHVGAILAAIRAAPIPKPPRARIICLGDVELPEIGELRFEPVIITPTRFMWKRLWMIPIALGLVALWLLKMLGVLPVLTNVPISSFGYFLVMGAIVGAIWLWRTTINPTYLRLAPGMVQVIEFGFGRRKPEIRSYPLEPGTVVIAQRAWGSQSLSVLIARGELIDTIPLWQMQGRQEATTQIWQALLSTAPTPPLSEDALLG